ncbi:hypothetical protein F4780DRAFT_789175, partial [Xylariomycetidae sp. FL0641]
FFPTYYYYYYYHYYYIQDNLIIHSPDIIIPTPKAIHHPSSSRDNLHRRSTSFNTMQFTALSLAALGASVAVAKPLQPITASATTLATVVATPSSALMVPEVVNGTDDALAFSPYMVLAEDDENDKNCDMESCQKCRCKCQEKSIFYNICKDWHCRLFSNPCSKCKHRRIKEVEAEEDRDWPQCERSQPKVITVTATVTQTESARTDVPPSEATTVSAQ